MSEEHKVVPTDGRGILAGDYLNENRPMTREIWLNECFPEWGTMLNQEIENLVVEKGKVALWWLGGPSWMLKTDEGAIFFIDVYSGPSHYTQYYYCGVCKQAGADTINWMRLNPVLIDPWKFNRLDAAFSTHSHQDHCDIYTVKAALQTTNCQFVAPPMTADRLRNFEVPEDRLNTAIVGESIKFPGVEVEFLMNYDKTAIKTGDGTKLNRYEDCCVSYLFKTSAGNILFMGDTWYDDAYKAIGDNYDIDVAIFDMGMNAPGATDKMTPYDCARLGETLKAKVLIPDHYDNWANTVGDPALLTAQLERIVHENTPEIKTVIMAQGGRFIYPDDQNIGRYRYPNQSQGYNPERSVTYGEYARKYGKKKN